MTQVNEGLIAGDLRMLVDNIFEVDSYASKMGEDKDIVVLAFTVKNQEPAQDLVEFVENGYDFVLDADASPGELSDGKYKVFVELERTHKLPIQIKDLLEGISQLCDFKEWKFKYYGESDALNFSEQTIMEHVPLDSESYEGKMLESRTQQVKEFFNQGATNISMEDSNTIIASKQYGGDVPMELIAIGHYDDIKELIPGGIQLDEASRSQVTFLEKYLGNYEINRIGGKFLIRNGDKGMIVKKDHW